MRGPAPALTAPTFTHVLYTTSEYDKLLQIWDERLEFPTLQHATLVRRYKRFLADCLLPDGTLITAHCPNTGAMTGCAPEGAQCWLSESDNPRRKLRYTLELVQTPTGIVCVHSALANKVIAEALHNDKVRGLPVGGQLRSEVVYGNGQRADFCVDGPDGQTYVEVKSVTLCRDNGVGVFPDTVSVRAASHARALTDIVHLGGRAVLIYCVFHTGIKAVKTAADIDPNYAEALRLAQNAGVRVLALATRITPQRIEVSGEIPYLRGDDCGTAQK